MHTAPHCILSVKTSPKATRLRGEEESLPLPGRSRDVTIQKAGDTWDSCEEGWIKEQFLRCVWGVGTRTGRCTKPGWAGRVAECCCHPEAWKIKWRQQVPGPGESRAGAIIAEKEAGEHSHCTLLPPPPAKAPYCLNPGGSLRAWGCVHAGGSPRKEQGGHQWTEHPEGSTEDRRCPPPSPSSLARP